MFNDTLTKIKAFTGMEHDTKNGVRVKDANTRSTVSSNESETQITLSSSVPGFDDFDETSGAINDLSSEKPKSIRAQLVQRDKLNGIQSKITLFAGDELRLVRKTPKDKVSKKYTFNLVYFRPEPVRRSNIAWKWFMVGMVAIAASGWMIYAGYFANMNQNIGVAGIVLGTTSIIMLLIFISKSRETITFYSAEGGAALIQFTKIKKSARELNAFVKFLTSEIRKCGKRSNDVKALLAVEMKALRRLADQGAVNNADYERARTKIFAHKAYKG